MPSTLGCLEGKRITNPGPSVAGSSRTEPEGPTPTGYRGVVEAVETVRAAEARGGSITEVAPECRPSMGRSREAQAVAVAMVGVVAAWASQS